LGVIGGVSFYKDVGDLDGECKPERVSVVNEFLEREGTYPENTLSSSTSKENFKKTKNFLFGINLTFWRKGNCHGGSINNLRFGLWSQV
jgi:hypothetical protein